MVQEKTPESPLDCKEIKPVNPKGKSTLSILDWFRTEYLGGLMLKLKLQYFGYLKWRANSLDETLILGKILGRRRGWQKWSDGIIDSMNISLNKVWEMAQGNLACCSPWDCKSWTQLSGWTTKAGWQRRPHLPHLVSPFTRVVFSGRRGFPE